MAFVNVTSTSANLARKAQEEENEQRPNAGLSPPESTKTQSKPGSSPASKELDHAKYYNKYECEDKWWKKAVIYEVYVRSFRDSNNDGIGDLKGIHEKIGYFKYLGVDTIWLTPMYPSPMVDFGYDISDFNGIDPMFGTIQDFKELLRAIKDHEMKMILDFVPNHTSDQHDWFKMSVLQQEPYIDYYVWKSPKNFDSNLLPLPPNNWKSVFGGSAWEYNETRKQFYLHQFAKEQPDLNFRNPLVIQEMINIMNFWLELGVDGFRLDAAPHILEDEEFRDNPPATFATIMEGMIGKPLYTEEDYCFWDHQFTCNCPGVLDILATFRSVCNEWSTKDGHERVLMTEGYLPLPELMKYYGTPSSPIAHFSFNFELLGLNKYCSALHVFKCICRWLDSLPEKCWPNWQTGNHDQPRISTKLGEDLVDIMNMILLLLPGSAVTFYGEELGMENSEISWEDTKDPAGKNAGPSRFHLFSRDPERSPMQWDSEYAAGFTDSGTPWLPVNPNFFSLNVKAQMDAERSHLKTYKSLIALRKTKAWQRGDLSIRVLCKGSVLAFSRFDKVSGEGLLVIANFSKNMAHVDVKELENAKDSSSLVVEVVTNLLDTYNEGSTVSNLELKVTGRSGLVCKFTNGNPNVTMSDDNSGTHKVTPNKEK